MIFLFSVVIFSCVSSDDDNAQTEGLEVNFNPPNWIIGTWYKANGNREYGWKFINNNAFYDDNLNRKNNFKEMMMLELNTHDFLTNQDDVIREIISSNNYTIHLTYHNPIQYGTYFFTKYRIL